MEVRCLCGASLTERDAAFAVSSDSRVRVYTSNGLVLLHEFSSIHERVLQMHHTTFCDAIVTLETKVGDDDMGDCYLCVYHDWRDTSSRTPYGASSPPLATAQTRSSFVRAYTLPLAISDPDAICMSVCSYSGRVAVGTPDGFGVNIWQTSDGFFEHVMEVKVNDPGLAFVAVHGAHLAVATATEVRVMEIQVITDDTLPSSTLSSSSKCVQSSEGLPKLSTSLPHERKKELIYNTLEKDRIPLIQIPGLSGGSLNAASNQGMCGSHIRIVGKDDAQLEAFNLAGLVQATDVRVNAALAYLRCHVHVLLQRFVPPNHSISGLHFVPETIDHRAQSRSYTRLLVTTHASDAILYYFLADHIDSTRDAMTRKILQRDANPVRGVVEPIEITDRPAAFASTRSDSRRNSVVESKRVVMYYKLHAPATSVTANSSFLFAATAAGVEVWSLWSPCHHVAAKKALDATFVPEPTQPQFLGVHPLSAPAANIVALDGYVVVLTRDAASRQLMHSACVAQSKSHEEPFELREVSRPPTTPSGGTVLVYRQSPPSRMFQQLKANTSGDKVATSAQLDLLLSLFSLYRFRADVGLDALQSATLASPMRHLSPKDNVAIQLEVKLYDSLARNCAAHIAHLYTTPAFRDLNRAALLYVASNISARDVLLRFRSLDDPKHGIQPDVIDATAVYLEGFLFPTKDPAMYLSPPVAASIGSAQGNIDYEFTGVVLRHYGDHAPEQLSRLAIDSSLPWTLLDIDYCLAKLQFAASVLIRTGVLVLLVRAHNMPDQLSTFLTAKEAVAATSPTATSAQDYSFASIATRIEWLAENYPDPLIHLCVTHPEFLVVQQADNSTDKTPSSSVSHAPRLQRSVLATGLLEKAPVKCLNALELIFHSALGHQNSVGATVAFCLGVLGDYGAAVGQRVQAQRFLDTNDVVSSGLFDTTEVYVLCAVHFIVLHLLKHATPDGTTLLPYLSLEFVHLCVRLSLSPSINCKAMLSHALASKSTLVPKKLTSLPPFVVPFLTAMLGSPKASHVNQTLHQLYLLASHIVATSSNAEATVVAISSNGDAEENHTLGTLLKLLLLPRRDKFHDGLIILKASPTYHAYLLSYAIANSTSLTDWKAFLNVVLTIHTAEPKRSDGGHLQAALDHMAATLSPQDLLAILPDDADAGLFLDALARAVRLHDSDPIAD
ncbi:hypothetical protein, variant [Aphanomyces invadans]|uniref:BLOC-2 complex member HPS3 N-terminal domain-containing protein n=1 Tax=Aphanomyces invadans TaxID=157072 RepID=A0A024U5M6_9STRA|nr:hypothetical protein, variant [Aphanomyces invadans]ETW01569.1 hypothetical protein, variant [Aphanomyces invadans]|eukprot:XP_008869417.1 hypothetical protein, variant [Aphanomyces invadans]